MIARPGNGGLPLDFIEISWGRRTAPGDLHGVALRGQVTQSSAQSSAASALLRIGSRGSPLALAQAREVRTRLAAACEVAPARIDIRVIRTSGDMIQDRPLAEAGGKGLFTKEIEEALLAGEVDLAVHSSKDMPTMLPDGLVLSAFLPREDVRDAFISRKAKTLRELPQGAVLGTASLRRQAMAKRLRSDLKVVPLRGNVETRLRKLDAGEVDATLLALAGLKRLGLAETATAVLEVDEFLPAVGQGAIGIETRADDAATLALVAAINDADTAAALAAERAFLAVLDGSCRTPIAGHATVDGDGLRFHGMILRPDGSEAYEAERTGRRTDAAALGADAGRELKGRAGTDFLSWS
jgi:hydroxymethylbilane synthase